jgi:nucleoid-associated protein YgaU
LNTKSTLKLLVLSLVLSSCGLIERFKTPEQPTDSKETTSNETSSETKSSDSSDDLFSKTMEETNTTTEKSDNPSNVAQKDDTLKNLEDEFSSSGSSNDTLLGETKSKEAPVIVEDSIPEISESMPTNSDAGTTKTYQVKRGETLMQIAFKLYGDIGKWKEIKNLNSKSLSSNSSLKQGTQLKYKAPDAPFVWNPAGAPYLIKTGETLGTISNSVYQTPKKWKSIWENNKPLIKNPNLIYAGFTLYYTNGGMANYVQPKTAQPKMIPTKNEVVEEIIVGSDNKVAPEISETQVLESAPSNLATEDQMDEAIQTLSAPKREEVKKAVNEINHSEKEIDLINNVTVPNEEIEMGIDEELKTL